MKTGGVTTDLQLLVVLQVCLFTDARELVLLNSRARWDLEKANLHAGQLNGADL